MKPTSPVSLPTSTTVLCRDSAGRYHLVSNWPHKARELSVCGRRFLVYHSQRLDRLMASDLCPACVEACGRDAT